MPTDNDTPAPESATPDPELTDSSPCPKCGEAGLWRESADVGIGIIYGPFGCECCGWSEAAKYDRSEGPAAADAEYKDRVCDQWGMAHYSPTKAASAEEPRSFADEVARGCTALDDGEDSP